MHLVQLFLPLYDNAGRAVDKATFARVRAELVARFGGMTAHSRAPVSGLWQEDAGTPVHDDLVIYEVMVETLDVPWWRDYRGTLEIAFGQEELVVRAQSITRL